LTPWSPAIAFGGVALGVVVTFIGQALTRRQTSALSIAEQKAALRNDRREAIYHFIAAAQRVYAMATIEVGDSVEAARAQERGLATPEKMISVRAPAAV
jgi:predicted transcriptional regulator